MRCEIARPLLAAYADGEASSEEMRAGSRHLEGCASCARELRWMAAMSAGLRSVPEPTMPAGLTDELLGLARRRRGREPSFWGALLTWRMPAGAGLASAMALGAGFFVFTRFLSAGAEELPLNEVLAAHSRYALTMPAADRETLYAGLAGEEDDDL